MTFLEALRELKEGRCEGIKRPRYDYPIRLNAFDTLSFNGDGLPTKIDAYLSDDWQLVRPTPQYEDVEVKVWAEVFKSTGQVMRTYALNDKPQSVGPECKIVGLTGRFPREIKPKVMRREELPRDSLQYRDMSPDTKFYAEWEE